MKKVATGFITFAMLVGICGGLMSPHLAQASESSDAYLEHLQKLADQAHDAFLRSAAENPTSQKSKNLWIKSIEATNVFLKADEQALSKPDPQMELANKALERIQIKEDLMILQRAAVQSSDPEVRERARAALRWYSEQVAKGNAQVGGSNMQSQQQVPVEEQSTFYGD